MSFAPSSPYLLKPASVSRVMTEVCLALVPAILVYALLVTPAILIQIVIASLAALAGEALLLKLREQPLSLFLSDGSALVTAWLIALALPPLSPWWLVVTGTLFAIVIAKQLYGGLGQNPFNPAMVAFAVCIVCFPSLMSQWPAVGSDVPLGEQLRVVFGGAPMFDALAGATPLDTLKTGLKLEVAGNDVASLLANAKIFGLFGGRGWEWVGLAYLAGGAFLLWRRRVTWHIPAAFLGALLGLAGALWLYDPAHFASPLFHLFSGATLLGAFFIVTDPVTACTTPRGKLIFGAGAGLLAYTIRVFGGYPDGVAFAVLLMNICAPLIDHLTQPPVFGHKKD